MQMLRKCSILFVLAVILTALLSVASLAQPQGAVSELTDLRTATGKIWLNEDGSRTAEISVAPIHYKDENDVWQDIDTTIGTAAKAGFGHSVVKNRFKTHLAANAKGRHAIEADGITFSFTADAALSSTGAVSGSSITYIDAWPDVDLKYQALPSGIKEDIILKKHPKVNEFRFVVDPGGLKPVTAGRGIDFVDSKGIAQVRIPGPVMFDADGEFSDAVEASWKESTDGIIELIVRPDEKWLEQASYPVTIDPTITIYTTSTSGQDGYYVIGTGVWYLTSPTLLMRNYTSGILEISCVQFDISSLPGNAVVTSTSISLYATGYVGAGRTVYMARNLEEWPVEDEQPSTGSTLASVAWSSTGYKSFSGTGVEEMVQKWITGQFDNYGVQFTCNEADYLNAAYAGEYSAAYRPKLYVSYSLDTTDPIPGTATSPTYDNSSPIVVSYSGATDTGSPQSGLKLVELWYKKGYNGTWTNSTLSSASASGSFNFTGMTDDDTYYFDLVAEDYAGNRSDEPTSGDGDCWTVYVSGGSEVSTDGSVFVTREYLYPGGPVKQIRIYDEDEIKVREVIQAYGQAGELLSLSGSTEPAAYTYNALYQTKSISDDENNVTSIVYDDDDDPNTEDPKVGAVSRIEYPGGDIVEFSERDLAGRVLKKIDPNQAVTQYRYFDTEGILSDIYYTSVSDPEIYAEPDVHFDYDTVYGRLAEMHDQTGAAEYAYDNLDVVLETATTYTGLPERTIVYEYWPDGSLSTLTVPIPGGTGEFNYTYDEAGRPTGLTNPFDSEFAWSYYDNDDLYTQTTPVTATSYEYNERGFLTELYNEKTDQTLLSQFTISPTAGYDAVGNLLSATAYLPNVDASYSGATGYTYDNRDQLLQEQSARDGSYTYQFVYDDAGNSTTLRSVSGRTFNENNQNSTFTYDDNGNPTYYNGETLVYDEENRLTSYGDDMTAGYTGDDLRAWKESGEVRKYYLYVGATPICEMDDDGIVTAVNTFGPNGLLARYESSDEEYYTFDPQGNTSQLIDSDGDIVSTHLYDAYGELLSATPSYPYGYNAQHGYYTDEETGLQLLTHRYYDPAEGRFLTRDPIGYAGGMNLYAYVGGNPINAIDPSGFCSGGQNDLPVNVHSPHDVAELGAAGAAMADAANLRNMQPGFWGIAITGTKNTLNDLGAGLLGVLDFGTGTTNFVDKPSLETAGGLCQDIATAVSFGAGGLSLGARLSATGAIATEGTVEADALVGCKQGSSLFNYQAFSGDQSALVDLAKQAKRSGGVNPDEAAILRQWADEYGLPSRGPEIHPNRNFNVEHIHIGKVNHIPVAR